MKKTKVIEKIEKVKIPVVKIMYKLLTQRKVYTISTELLAGDLYSMIEFKFRNGAAFSFVHTYSGIKVITKKADKTDK